MKTEMQFFHFVTYQPIEGYWGNFGVGDVQVIPNTNETLQLRMMGARIGEVADKQTYQVTNRRHVFTNTGLGKIHTVQLFLRPIDDWHE